MRFAAKTKVDWNREAEAPLTAAQNPEQQAADNLILKQIWAILRSYCNQFNSLKPF